MMRPFSRRKILMTLAGLMTTAPYRPAFSQTVRTDLNLAIAIDCSYSVNRAEFRLQVEGIANALVSDDVIAAIENGPRQQIGLTIYQWAGPDTQAVVISWTLIASLQDALNTAEKLVATPRMTAEGVTAMGSALVFGKELHDRAPFFAERQVIDMQADGTSTWSRGVPIQQARNHAVNAGIVVNGLPILNEVPFLNHYFENHVIGGPGAFIEIARDYSAFANAIQRKLVREIKGVPLS